MSARADEFETIIKFNFHARTRSRDSGNHLSGTVPAPATPVAACSVHYFFVHSDKGVAYVDFLYWNPLPV